ncbi:MAG: CPBP family intramembrane metalloprotease, partial [Prevotellaceae bacterium]|nr:CPBP family intramembrane metalloprotease [Prevotellaceae bacterium]
FISYLLYGYSISNSFVYIAQANAPEAGLIDSQRFTLFLIGSIVSMAFSPLGEEFLYRGVIHGSFVAKFGEVKASFFDSLAFGLTHLAHFGIIYNAGIWQFFPIPSLIWVISMFLASQVFFWCKQMSSSIWGAVLSHAGYNFTMMYFIFYHIL